jgi:hypothetical protein
VHDVHRAHYLSLLVAIQDVNGQTLTALGHKLKSGGGKADLFHESITFLNPQSLAGFCRDSLAFILNFLLSNLKRLRGEFTGKDRQAARN